MSSSFGCFVIARNPAYLEHLHRLCAAKEREGDFIRGCAIFRNIESGISYHFPQDALRKFIVRVLEPDDVRLLKNVEYLKSEVKRSTVFAIRRVIFPYDHEIRPWWLCA